MSASDYQNEKKKKETQLRTQINQRLEESGEKERLREYLRKKLRESGWRENLKEHCKDILVKKGLNNVTVDGLVEEITPRARATVPDDVKKDLLKQIKDFIDKNA